MRSIAKPDGRIRIVSALASAGLLLMMFALGTSRSTNGAFLGIWSFAVGGAFLLFLFVLICFILAAFGMNRINERLVKTAEKLPELTGPLLLFAVPSSVFLAWFLSLSMLFQRVSFASGAFLTAFVPGSLLIVARDGRELKRILTGTALMGASIVLVLAAGELLLRRIMPDQIFNPRFGLRPYSHFELEVDLPGITPGGVLSTNRWGFRGEDPPENWNEYLTIVTVGGSTTANYYLDDSLTWSHVLQTSLRSVNPRVWVGNAGIPRHSADTHALFLQEVLAQIKPDVAVFLVGVNDLGPFLRGAAGGEERLENSGARPWLFSRSMILQLVYKIKIVLVDKVTVINTAVDPSFEPEQLTTVEMSLPLDLHDLLVDPDFYRNRILRLIGECRELGITPVFLTQPLLYEDNEYWRSIREAAVLFQGTERPISAATFALMLETLNGDLLEVCRDQGVMVYDLAVHVPHSQVYFYDAMHMTEAGADLVGGLVAGFLIENLAGDKLVFPED